MNPFLRLYYLFFVVLLPIGSLTGSEVLGQTPDKETFAAIVDAADYAPIIAAHTVLVQENDLREQREETQEEEEESLGEAVTTFFQFPLVDCSPESSAFVFRPWPQFFKRYLHFHALKLFC